MSMDSMLVEFARSSWFRVWNEELACGKTPASWRVYDTVSTFHNRRGGRGEPQYRRLSVSLKAGCCVGWALGCGVCPGPGLTCSFLWWFLCPGSHRRKRCLQDTWNVQHWQIVCQQWLCWVPGGWVFKPNKITVASKYKPLAREHEGTERDTPSHGFAICHSH